MAGAEGTARFRLRHVQALNGNDLGWCVEELIAVRRGLLGTYDTWVGVYESPDRESSEAEWRRLSGADA